MQVAVISTSPRGGSSSLKVARAVAHAAQAAGHTAQVIHMEQCDIPMVGRGSVDPAQLTDFQRIFTDQWAAADLVIFTLPEYNWTNGGEFVNMVHQLGGKAYAHLFHQKVFGLVGVSAGRGGRLPAIDASVLLSKIIAFTGGVSVISPKIYEAHEVPKNIDSNGNSLGNEIFDRGLVDFVGYSLTIAKQFSN
jgi:chromate reductase, NAD(P)H dehydrogenase (quinone)